MNRFIKAPLLLLAGLLGTISMPAGCGGGEKAADGDLRTIQLVRNLGGREGFKKHVEAWKAAFESSNPGWRLEVVDLGNGDAGEYYKSRIATDDLPEIVQTWGLTNMLADGGHLRPLPDGFYEEFGVPVPEAYKGAFYATQGGIQIMGLAINKALWEKAGLTGPPNTWEELFDDLRALKSKGIRPVAFGGKEWSAAIPLSYLLQTGLYVGREGDSWTRRRDRGEVRFATDPQVRRSIEVAIRFADEFVEKGALSDAYNEEQRDFYGGKAATWIMGCWIGGDIEANEVPFEIEYWPVPSWDGGPPVFLGGQRFQSGWAITTAVDRDRTGETYEKAVAACRSFYEPDVYQLWINGEAMLPTASKVEAVTGPRSDWPQAQRLFDDMARNLERYGSTPGALISLEDQWPPSFDQSLMRVMQEIVSGNRDVPALAKMLDDDWDSARKAR